MILKYFALNVVIIHHCWNNVECRSDLMKNRRNKAIYYIFPLLHVHQLLLLLAPLGWKYLYSRNFPGTPRQVWRYDFSSGGAYFWFLMNFKPLFGYLGKYRCDSESAVLKKRSTQKSARSRNLRFFRRFLQLPER